MTLPNRVKDISGEEFGLLRVVRFSGMSKRGANWMCVCRCGKTCEANGSSMRSGNTSSCGCLQKSMVAAAATVHGYSRRGKQAPEYIAWLHIIGRCENPLDKHWESYGGRGISVCQTWRNSFTAFLEDVGERPSPRHSIDRIDNDGNYKPGNVRWATRKEQQNNRRNTIFLTVGGVRRSLSDWSKETGISLVTLRSRVRLGWSDTSVVGTPIYRSGSKPVVQRSIR